jgi:probable phosphoglycerate mutase
MKIIFVRHGHPNYEKNCLTELGHLHAAAAAQRLKDEGIEEIYSSPYGRAVETAEHTAKLLGKDVKILDFMHEIIWGEPGKEPYKTGHPWSLAEEMAANGMDLMRQDWRESSPFKDNLLIAHCDWLNAELDKWLATLGYTREGCGYRVGKNTNRTIALFSHGGSSVAAMAHLMNLPIPFAIYTLRPDYTAIIELEFSDEEGTLTMPKFGLMHDAKHIEGLKVETVFGN